MSNNRLAPNAYNALYNRVPDPTARTPEYAPPLGIRQQLENVSAGLGRGAVTQLQDVQALVSDPRAYATNTLRGMRELMRNPALIGNVLRDTARRAKSGPLGLGEVVGEMLPLRPGKKAPSKMASSMDNLNDSPQQLTAKQTSKYIPEGTRGNVSLGIGHQNFEALVVNPAKKAVAEGKSISVKLKDNTTVSLVRFVDDGEERLLALSPNGDVIGDMGYTLSEGFHPTIFVSENAQRKGLATAMYDVAKKAGASIPAYSDPSSVRTPAGEAFRKARESTRRAK